jgi:HPt (histidine-containing phosphotransfer) domain-containing protein
MVHRQIEQARHASLQALIDRWGAIFNPASLQALNRLDLRGDQHLVERLISGFHTSLAGLPSRLEHAVSAHDADEVRKLAHGLKSAASYLGAVELARLSGDVEHCISHGTSRLEECPVAQLRQEVSRVYDAVSRELKVAADPGKQRTASADVDDEKTSD